MPFCDAYSDLDLHYFPNIFSTAFAITMIESGLKPVNIFMQDYVVVSGRIRGRLGVRRYYRAVGVSGRTATSCARRARGRGECRWERGAGASRRQQPQKKTAVKRPKRAPPHCAKNCAKMLFFCLGAVSRLANVSLTLIIELFLVFPA